MASFIDADLLIEELKELQKLSSPSLAITTNEAINLGLSLAMRTARKTPTADVVEVVRCEKCKYCVTHTCAITGIKTLFCDYGEKPAMVHPTHFCSYGKKKNDFKE